MTRFGKRGVERLRRLIVVFGDAKTKEALLPDSENDAVGEAQ